jgi:HEAT repeat protein
MTWWTRRASGAFAELAAREPLIAADAVREISEHQLARHALARELCAGLQHGPASVRAMTVDALTGLGSREAVPALIRALEDKDLAVRRACLAALRALTGEDHGEEPDDWAGLVAAR